MFARATASAAVGARQTAGFVFRSPLTISRRGLLTSTFKRPCVGSESRIQVPTPTTPSPGVTSAGETLDLLPKISTHPALASIQVRNGPRNTLTGFTHFKRKRRVGFLARKRCRTGQHILVRRRLKRRTSLAH